MCKLMLLQQRLQLQQSVIRLVFNGLMNMILLMNNDNYMIFGSSCTPC